MSYRLPPLLDDINDSSRCNQEGWQGNASTSRVRVPVPCKIDI